MPVLKTLVFILIVLIAYPILGGLVLFVCLWNWSWKPWKEALDMPFSSTQGIVSTGENNISIETICYYKTVWDWYVGKKTIIYDLETSGF